MDRRTALKAMLGGGLGILGCKEKQLKPLQVGKRLTELDKDMLVHALIQVESGGRREVRGKNGELGPLQIKEIYVDDVNRIITTTYPRVRKSKRQRSYTYEDRGYISTSFGLVRIYWDHYATVERLGREPTLEDLARIHNGGPNGWRKESTKGYWVKVKWELERMEG